MMNMTKFQIGKSGVTPGVIDSLVLAVKNHKQVRISTLKASGRTRDTMPAMAEDIAGKLRDKLREPFTTRVIGFTIILIRETKYARK